MSKIAELPGRIRLYINENDHEPPHLHLFCGEGRFRVRFGTYEVEVIAGSRVKARLPLARTRAWMRAHADYLDEQWQRQRRNEKVRPFDTGV